MERGVLSLLRGFVAILAIYIAVVARIPTSHCRCHEKKPVEQTTQKCPFGELRLLAQFTLLSGVVDIPRPDFISTPIDSAPPISFAVPVIRYVDARAPPYRSV